MLDENLVLRVIDRYEWKHSWHLPSTRYGHTDWCNLATLEQCLAVAQRYGAEATQFASECTAAVEMLADAIAHRKRVVAEDAQLEAEESTQ